MNKRTSANHFGAKGWILILFGIICLFCNNAGVTDGLNVSLPFISENAGLDYNICLSIGTVAGFVGVVLLFLIGKLRDKIGSSRMSGILMILFGCAFFFLFLHAENLVMYAIGMCIMVSCGQGTFFLCIGSMQTTWFPKKKGVVVGISTIGSNIASAVLVPIMTVLVTVVNYKIGLSVFAVFPIVMGVLCLLILKDNPLEAGVYPDHVTKEQYETEYAVLKEEGADYVSDWTIKKLLRTKELYLAALVPGIMGMVLVGIITQFVSRNMALGLSQAGAVGAMTIASICGMIGSWLTGVLDTKIGTKKAAMLYCGGFACGVLCSLLAVWIPGLTYVSIVIIGASLGGTTNFQITWPASIFGSLDYPFVNKIIFPMENLIVSLNYVVNGLILHLTGNQTIAYVIYFVLLLVDILIIKFTDAAKWDKMVHEELV